MLDGCDLRDLGFDGNPCTWNSKRAYGDNVQERLDRFCADNRWRNMFPKAKVDHLGFFMSDHCLVRLSLERSKTFQAEIRSKSFKLEPFWLTEEECGEIVKGTWNKQGRTLCPEALDRKLLLCAKELRAWGKEKFGVLSKNIELKQRSLNSLMTADPSKTNWENIQKLEKELGNLLAKEELYWHQRARVNWLKAGDQNTKFFHLKAKARRRKNEISSIMDDQGKVHNQAKDIVRAIEEHYPKLFYSSAPSEEDMSMATEFIEGRYDLAHLSAPFQADEVKRAIFEMGPTKAPGSDEFHALFFQRYWEVVGADVSSFCFRILNGLSSTRKFNDTNILLIPKKKNPAAIKDSVPQAYALSSTRR